MAFILHVNLPSPFYPQHCNTLSKNSRNTKGQNDCARETMKYTAYRKILTKLIATTMVKTLTY